MSLPLVKTIEQAYIGSRDKKEKIMVDGLSLHVGPVKEVETCGGYRKMCVMSLRLKPSGGKRKGK